MGGALVVVATPIGNLGDLAPRAVEALAEADVIACEDSRHTGRLLRHAGVEHGRLLVVNDHNEARQRSTVVDRVRSGDRVAVVTDAGTPGVSDPGERLVRAVLDADLPVEVVPGPSAAVAALVVSGLSTGRFVFEGFLPRRGTARDERLVALESEPRTTVLYEAPHRVAATVAELAERLGPDRRVAVARELTKLHEEVWRGSLGEAATRLATVRPRGEYVLVLAGAEPEAPPDDDALVDELRAALDGGASRRDASHEVARRHGVSRRRVYELANQL